MKPFATRIRAEGPDRRLLEFEGPFVHAHDFDDAQNYCDNSGLGFCTVFGEYHPTMSDAESDTAVVSPLLVAMDPEEAFVAITALKTIEKITRNSPEFAENKMPLIDLLRRTWQKMAATMSVFRWHAAQDAKEILQMTYKLDDVVPEKDYRSVTSMTDILLDDRLYSSVYMALAAVRIPGTTWFLDFTEREIAAVLPYMATDEGLSGRHMARLEEATRQKFKQEPYRSLLIQEENMNFVDPDAGLCYRDFYGQVVREAVDMTDLLTRIREELTSAD